MDRRSFFKRLGAGLAVAAVAPSLLTKMWPAPDPVILDAGVGGWVSYKFHMTVTLPPDHTWRVRYIQAGDDGPAYVFKKDGENGERISYRPYDGDRSRFNIAIV